MRKSLLFIILLSGLTLGARGQSEPEIDLSGLPQKTTASSLRYWFDTDADNVQTSNTLNGAATINAATLKEGIHTIHYQIVDNKGIAGIPASKMFIKVDPKTTATAKSLRYWFDTDADNIQTSNTLNGAATINAATLKEGIHTIHYQIMDNQGTVGITNSKMFIKVDPKTTATAKSLRYWFDTDADNVLTSNTLNGAATINASALKEGIHTIHYQIMDSKDIAGIPVSRMFIKIDPKTTATAKKLRYWFDTDAANVTITETLAGATTIDASALKEGIHTVHYQIEDDKGVAGIPVSALFIKLDKKTVAEATAVRYWFNEDDANAKEGAITTEVQIVDASKLKKGKHEIHYQLVAANGEVFPVCSGIFEKINVIPGDTNNDGEVNVADVDYVIEAIGEDYDTYKDADANIDGEINVADVDFIIERIE